MAKFNKYCLKCLSYHTKNEFGVKGCIGTEEYSAETSGCMHCFVAMTGSKKGDKIKNLEMKAVSLKAKLKEHIYLKRELKKTETLIEKLKQSYG